MTSLVERAKSLAAHMRDCREHDEVDAQTVDDLARDMGRGAGGDEMTIDLKYLIPIATPFATVLLVRALWTLTGLPWEPTQEGAIGLVTLALSCMVMAAMGVSIMDDYGIRWTVTVWRKGESNE